MDYPSNGELQRFEPATFEAYVDEGMWMLESWMRNPNSIITHFQLSMDDEIED